MKVVDNPSIYLVGLHKLKFCLTHLFSLTDFIICNVEYIVAQHTLISEDIISF